VPRARYLSRFSERVPARRLENRGSIFGVDGDYLGPFCQHQLRDRIFIYCTAGTLSVRRAASNLLRVVQMGKKDCSMYFHSAMSYLAKPVR
jgi:hypothetical protein